MYILCIYKNTYAIIFYVIAHKQHLELPIKNKRKNHQMRPVIVKALNAKVIVMYYKET